MLRRCAAARTAEQAARLGRRNYCRDRQAAPCQPIARVRSPAKNSPAACQHRIAVRRAACWRGQAAALSELSLAVIEAIGQQPSPPPAGERTPTADAGCRPGGSTTAHDIAGKRAHAVGCPCRAGGRRRRKRRRRQRSLRHFTVPAEPSWHAPVEPDLAAAKSLRGALIYFTWSAESQIDLLAAGRGLSMDEREESPAATATAAQWLREIEGIVFPATAVEAA